MCIYIEMGEIKIEKCGPYCVGFCNRIISGPVNEGSVMGVYLSDTWQFGFLMPSFEVFQP